MLIGIWGLGILGLQLILAAVLFRHRMGFLDASFVFNQILLSGDLNIMVGRYGSFVTQIFPLIGLKFGLDYEFCVFLYGLSFNLFALAGGYILFRINAFKWIWVLVCYQLLFVSDGFFWTNNEIHQAMVWFCLAMGLFEYMGQQGQANGLRYGVFFVLSWLAISTHPLMLVVCGYVIGIEILQLFERKSAIDWKKLAILLFGLIAKWVASLQNWYDGDKLSQVRSFDFANHPSWPWLPNVERFFMELVTTYHIGLLVFGFLMWVFFNRFTWSIVFALLSLFTYVVMVAMVVPDYHKFYIESQWMLISVILVLPIFDKVLEIPNVILKLVLFLSMIMWMVQFAPALEKSRKRLDFHKFVFEKLRDQQVSKAMISGLPAEKLALLEMPWGLPTESLLLSKIWGEKPITWLLIGSDRDTINKDVFHDCFQTIPISKFPSWMEVDTLSPYRVKVYDELFE